MSTNESHKSETSVSEQALPASGGGVRPWAAIVASFLTAMSTYGYVNTFGVYQDHYTRSNFASASAISWIGSTQLFLVLAGALPAGKLLDMGYFRHTTLVGSIIYVFSVFMLSICDSTKYYQLYLSQGLGMGIGGGLLYAPSVAVQAHFWQSHRAFAMGIVVSGTSVGGIIFPIILNTLFKEDPGFNWGVRVTAFMILLFLMISNIIMPKAEYRPQAISRPSTISVLKDVPYLASIAGTVFINWGLLFPCVICYNSMTWFNHLLDFYLQLFSIVHNVDANIAFYTLAIMNGSALPARIIPNILGDRFGVYNVILPFIIVCCALVFSLLAISTAAGVIVFSVLYGFSSGAFLSLCGPAVSVLCRGPNEVGIRFGLAYAITGLGALLSGPINGALLGSDFIWLGAIVFSGVSFIVGFLFQMVTRQILVKRNKTQLV